MSRTTTSHWLQFRHACGGQRSLYRSCNRFRDSRRHHLRPYQLRHRRREKRHRPYLLQYNGHRRHLGFLRIIVNGHHHLRCSYHPGYRLEPRLRRGCLPHLLLSHQCNLNRRLFRFQSKAKYPYHHHHQYHRLHRLRHQHRRTGNETTATTSPLTAIRRNEAGSNPSSSIDRIQISYPNHVRRAQVGLLQKCRTRHKIYDPLLRPVACP